MIIRVTGKFLSCLKDNFGQAEAGSFSLSCAFVGCQEISYGAIIGVWRMYFLSPISNFPIWRKFLLASSRKELPDIFIMHSFSEQTPVLPKPPRPHSVSDSMSTLQNNPWTDRSDNNLCYAVTIMHDIWCVAKIYENHLYFATIITVYSARCVQNSNTILCSKSASGANCYS